MKFLRHFERGEIFLRLDYLPPAIYPAGVEKRIIAIFPCSAEQSELSVLRMWRARFYRAAAEAGVLVWQDFPLNLDYPADQAARALTQAGEFTRFPGRHPAVIVSSILNASGYEERRVKPGSRLRPLAEKLARKLGEDDPARPVIAVSGQRSLFSPSDTGFGHGVAAEEGELYRFDRYRKGIMKKNIRFVSWFGAPSFSGVETVPAQGGRVAWEQVPRDLRTLLERDIFGQPFLNQQDGKPDVMAKNGRVRRIAAASQKLQGEILRFTSTRLRSRNNNPTGEVFFCLRNLVPVPSGRWTRREAQIKLPGLELVLPPGLCLCAFCQSGLPGAGPAFCSGLFGE